MTIAIFGSPYPEHFKKYIQHLIKKLDAEHVKLIVEENLKTPLNISRFVPKRTNV